VRIPGVPGTERPLVQWLLVLTCLVVLVLAVLLVRRERAASATVHALREELEARREAERRLESRLARERSAREAFELSLSRERDAQELPTVPLRAGLARDGRPVQQVRVPAGAGHVRFVLSLPSTRFHRYRVALRPFAGGDELWVHGALRPLSTDPGKLVVVVPAELLAPGAYELSLGGLDREGRRQDIATFTFDVDA